MKNIFLNKIFGKHLFIWIILLSLVEISLFIWISLLEVFYFFAFLFIFFTAFLTTFSQSLIRVVLNKYIKCVFISFILYLISVSVILPYGVLLEFMKIEIGRSPAMLSVFLRGLTYAVINGLYVFALSYSFLVLSYRTLLYIRSR